MKKIFILILGLSLVAAACNKTTTITTEPNPPPPPPVTSTGPVEIDITASGFSPDSVSVASGTVVTFKNMDSKTHQPASDPHPTHTDLPGFDSTPGIKPGGSYSFTFVKVGTWGFHDHLFPTFTGSVTVQ